MRTFLILEGTKVTKDFKQYIDRCFFHERIGMLPRMEHTVVFHTFSKNIFNKKVQEITIYLYMYIYQCFSMYFIFVRSAKKISLWFLGK